MGVRGDGDQRFWKLARELERYPGFRILPKERSPLMRLVYWGSLAFLWCPTFLTEYTTVLVSRVYMPERLMGSLDGYRILRHEAIHIRDCFRVGILPFVVSYLFLLPAVFTFRAWWEYRAYLETMRVELELTGTIAPQTVDWLVERFTGSDYLWMCPFPGFVRRRFGVARQRMLAEAARGGQGARQ